MSAVSAQVVRAQDSARSLVDPVRRGLLLKLVEPDSASGVARKTGIPRQKVNYHLREMEKAGLVKLVEERKKGNCTERIVQATAAMFVISSEILGSLGADPTKIRDKMSEAYLVALAARAIQELAILRERADAVGKSLQTFSLHADVKFSSQTDLNAFSEELSNTVAQLTAKYGRDDHDSGRTFRFLIGAYPAITKSQEQAQAEADAAKNSSQTG